MSDSRGDGDLDPVVQRIMELCRPTEGSERHKALLRGQLMRRHVELYSRRRERRTSQWRLVLDSGRRPRGLAPALLVAAALTVAAWALQVSGHSRSQSVEAARLADALARTVPTLTSWHMTLHRVRGNTASANRCDTMPLGPGQRLSIRGDHSFLYSDGQWHQFTIFSAGGECPAEWQWAFTQLPARLNHPGSFQLLSPRPVGGRRAVGVRYTVQLPGREQLVAVAWVDEQTGLILRLQRSVMRGSRVVELDSADYRYERAP